MLKWLFSRIHLPYSFLCKKTARNSTMSDLDGTIFTYDYRARLAYVDFQPSTRTQFLLTTSTGVVRMSWA